MFYSVPRGAVLGLAHASQPIRAARTSRDLSGPLGTSRDISGPLGTSRDISGHLGTSRDLAGPPRTCRALDRSSFAWPRAV